MTPAADTPQVTSKPKPALPPLPAEFTAGGFSLRGASSAGRLDAPVVVVEFFDYQCEASRTSLSTTYGIISTYAETGQVIFGVKHLPLIGQESFDAAAAAECAADQGKFWDYSNALFAHQGKQQNIGRFVTDQLLTLGDNLGRLDMPAFRSCVKNAATMGRVQGDLAQGQAAGLTFNPSFLVNGRLTDSEKWTDVARAIEAALGHK